MPHYSNGEPASIGDVVTGKDYGGRLVGVVCSITPGADTCNMQVRRLATIYGEAPTRVVVPSQELATVSCKDFLKVALVLLALTLLTGAASAQDAAPRIGPLTAIDGIGAASTSEPAAVEQQCTQCQQQ